MIVIVPVIAVPLLVKLIVPVPVPAAALICRLTMAFPCSAILGFIGKLSGAPTPAELFVPDSTLRIKLPPVPFESE